MSNETGKLNKSPKRGGYQAIGQSEHLSSQSHDDHLAQDTQKIKDEDKKHHAQSDSDTINEELFLVYIGLAFVGYLCFCTVVYWYSMADGENDIDIVDSLYLTLITFTTIGYGDIVPHTTFTKLFTCFVVFTNLMLVGQMLDYLVDYAVAQRMEMSQEFFSNVFDEEVDDEDADDNEELRQKKEAALNAKVKAEADLIASYWLEEKYHPIWDSLIGSLTKIGATLAVGTVMYSSVVDDHPLIDAFYMSCMTITTVGYGDIVPSSELSRGFTTLYSVVGTLTFGASVSGFIGSVSEYRLIQKNETILASTVLDIETLLEADADGDNSVDKNEFVLFRLGQMGLIPQALRLRAEQQFDRMDLDGSGELDADDIKIYQEQQQRHQEKYDHHYSQHTGGQEPPRRPSMMPRPIHRGSVAMTGIVSKGGVSSPTSNNSGSKNSSSSSLQSSGRGTALSKVREYPV